MRITEAEREVIAERLRQKRVEGFGAYHDDQHTNGELAQAAACYAFSSIGFRKDAVLEMWPHTWSPVWFKPDMRRRELVKAAAMLIAEIERLDRKQERETVSDSVTPNAEGKPTPD